jgi:hypothetical protein
VQLRRIRRRLPDLRQRRVGDQPVPACHIKYINI